MSVIALAQEKIVSSVANQRTAFVIVVSSSRGYTAVEPSPKWRPKIQIS